MEFEEGDKVTVLGCNDKHFLHMECGNQWLKSGLQKKLTCFLCRKPVEASKLKKMVYKGLMDIKPVEVEDVEIGEAQEMFELDPKEQQEQQPEILSPGDPPN